MRLFRNFLIGLFLTIAAVGAMLFIPSKQAPAPMPWEITIMPDGKSKVFGIHLGTTTYAHTNALFHEYGNIAAFSDEGKASTVEVFFNSIHLAGITGKLVLNLDVPEQQITDMMAHAYEARLQDSGAHRYEINNKDKATVVTAPIIAITYVPSVKLSADIARYRFGEPESISQDPLEPKTTIWHYPVFGLTIRMNDDEKTILQYQ
ncbi:hypothetical protein LCGC14_0742750 [marine sediment metagenome]|uniref:Lytic murein transglycosylase n=1 Tax=marine sediment metagenome TaxID=412755 RepID=A0A0F9SRA3_9ZZZZ|nr:lytic murein transglycosylase [Methylophaga sp.]